MKLVRAALVHSSTQSEDIRILGGERVKFEFDRSGHHRAWVGDAAADNMRTRKRLYLLDADAENCFRESFGASSPEEFRAWLTSQAKIHPKEVAAYCQALSRRWRGRETLAGIVEYSRLLDGLMAECEGGLKRQKTIAAVKDMTDKDDGLQEEKSRLAAAEHLKKQQRAEAHAAALAAAEAAGVEIPEYPEGALLSIDEDGYGDPVLVYVGTDGARRVLTGEGEWVDAAAAEGSDDLASMKPLTVRERIVAAVRLHVDPKDDDFWRSDNRIRIRKIRELCKEVQFGEDDIDAAWLEFAGEPLTRTSFAEWKEGGADGEAAAAPDDESDKKGKGKGKRKGRGKSKSAAPPPKEDDPESSPTRANRIISAIMENADPDNDLHWRNDGGISILAVEEWFGDSSPSEEEVTEAWASFADDPLTRENFRALQSAQSGE